MKHINYKNLNSISINVLLYNHLQRELDITELFLDIEIIEDIYNNCISGYITVIDTIGLKEFFPVIGEEKIKITFTTDENEFSYFNNEFYIIKISNEESITSKSKIVKGMKIYFTSIEQLNNYKYTFSKSYNHQNISDIFNDIFNNLLKSKKTVNIEETKNSINFIIPYWNPFKSINFLCKHALSKKYNDSGYIFFQDKEKFNFVSIISLLKNNDKQYEIVLHDIKQNEKKTVGYIGNAEEYKQIKTVDIIKSLKDGTRGNTVYTWDFSLKSYVKNTIDFEKSHTNTNVGNFTLFKKEEIYNDSNINIFNNYINDRIVGNLEYQNQIHEQTKITLRNKIIYKLTEENLLSVVIAGNSDLTAGKLVNVKYRSSDKNELLNEKLNGIMLIKGMKHKISAGGYKNVLLLSKPFYTMDRSKITKEV